MIKSSPPVHTTSAVNTHKTSTHRQSQVDLMSSRVAADEPEDDANDVNTPHTDKARDDSNQQDDASDIFTPKTTRGALDEIMDYALVGDEDDLNVVDRPGVDPMDGPGPDESEPPVTSSLIPAYETPADDDAW